MKKLFLFFTPPIFVIVLFFINGCKKEPNFTPKEENKLSANSVLSDRSGEGGESLVGGSGPTVLGSKLSNPYKVAVIKEAYNNLYEPNITTLNPNYLYVRFLPTTPEDVKKLLDSGLDLTDFPLDYEIQNFGERYHDPNVPAENMTWQYAVIDVDAPMPSVNHEILEELALVSDESAVAQEAFRLTNNTYEVPEEFASKPVIANNRFKFVPDHETQPLENGGRAGECDCPTPNLQRKPSGCVQVFDNALNMFEGVKQVNIITSKTQAFGFIFHRQTRTDLNGCWIINHKYWGHIDLWVKFESGTCDVKVMEGVADLVGYSFPRRTNMGTFYGPNFNGISIKYNFPTSFGDKAYHDWMAATTNNSAHQYKAYSAEQQIPAPQGNLKILVTPWANSGAALMMDKMGFVPNFVLVSSVSSLLTLFGALSAVGTLVTKPLVALTVWLTVCAPDLVINRNVVDNTDNLKETIFHELAHAQHFDKVGNSYWLNNVAYVLGNATTGNNPPYGGNPQTSGSGRCAIIEAWGESNGMQACHNRYGLNHTNSTNPLTKSQFTYQSLMERDIFFDIFIPYAWHADLLDDNAKNPSGTNENSTVTDGVKGYTRAQIFSTMTSSMLSPGQHKNALITTLPFGVSTANMNTLAAPYGF